MNRLRIRNCLISFNTDAERYEDAYIEFESVCEEAGINVCGGNDGVLLDEDGEEID